MLDEIMMADPRFVGMGELVAFAPFLFDGIVASHRVTASELSRGAVSIERSLGVLDWGVAPGTLTIDGRPAELRGAELIGPSGWLDGVESGDVIAIGRRGPDLVLDRSPTLGDGGREADALVAAGEALGTEHGIELTSMMAEAIVVDPTLFRQPVPPMSELLWSRGMERRRHLWGFSSWIWAPRHLRSEAMGPMELRLAAFEDSVVDDLTPAADVAKEIVDDLLVVADEHDLATVEALLEVPSLGTTERAILRASLAERSGDPVSAQETLTTVWEVDPVAAVGARLAEYALWAGDLTAARRYAAAAGDSAMADDCMKLSRGRDRLLRGTPRNAPCPCGSGSKFKKCCLRAGSGVTTQQSAAVVRAKLAMTVGLRLPGVLGDEMAIESARHRDLGKTRAPLMPVSERQLFDAVLREPMRIWEVVRTRDQTATVRSGDLVVDVADLVGSVGDRVMARILPDHGVVFGAVEPVPPDQSSAVAAELGPDPRLGQVAAALRLLE